MQVLEVFSRVGWLGNAPLKRGWGAEGSLAGKELKEGRSVSGMGLLGQQPCSERLS